MTDGVTTFCCNAIAKASDESPCPSVFTASEPRPLLYKKKWKNLNEFQALHLSNKYQ